MAEHELNAVLGFLQKVGTVAEAVRLSDRQLLRQFALDGDQRAFATLVRRHGSLVLGVCRRRLRNAEDAEDAFQAVFLVLARKAGSDGWQESVGGWLHEVACRVAAEARGKQARRRTREKQMDEVPDVAAPPEPEFPELLALLDEEVRRLPEKYRAPLVLCCLEGQTRDEAAEQLGWTVGAVKGRLERGREMLRKRLARRGLALGTALGAALLPGTSEAAGLAALVGRAVELAVSARAGLAVSGPAAELANAVLAAMLGAKVKTLTAVALGLVLLGTGATVWASRTGAGALPESGPPAARLGPPAERPGEPVAPARPVEERLVGTRQTSMKHGGPVRTVSFMPDGKRTLSPSLDGTVRVWDASRGYMFRQWLTDGMASAVAISPDGKLVVVGTDKGELIGWEFDNSQERFARLTHQENVYALAFSPDGKLLASANHLGTVTLHIGSDGRRLRQCAGHEGRVWSVAFSPDGKTLASAGEDGTVRLWDPSSGKQTRLLVKLEKDAGWVAFRPDGARLASLGRDGMLRVWDLRTGEALYTVEAGNGYSLAFSPDGARLALAQDEGEAAVWDAEAGKRLTSVRGHEGKVYGVAFSPDGARLATSGEDGSVLVWKLTSEKVPAGP